GISFLVRGFSQLTSASIGMASDAGELGSKFDFVFGDKAGEAKSNLDQFAGVVGRSKQSMYEMASGLQSILVPMGLSREKAANMSTAFSKLSVDIGSFNNESETDVMDAMKAALIGNAEAVRKYGIVINETTLQQQLLKMGVAGGTAAASEQQKVMAR